MLETYNNFEKIVTDEIPLIDVRAPIEFSRGAFFNATNLPLMDNEERHLVGTCYKEKGNTEAVKLGHQLVSGEIRQGRIEAWVSYLKQHPHALLYCFRGGLRSQISQQWILERTGKEIARLEGGYKTFRTYLLSQLEGSEQGNLPILLGGCTGSGKTLLLKNLNNAIDLEGLANHRGSSFGKNITPQPTQINFENNLAYALIQHKSKGYHHLILEDEGKHVGKCFLPKPLFEHFNSGQLVIIERPLEERVTITMDEYVIESQKDYLDVFGENEGLDHWFKYMIESINKIKKRLGGELWSRINSSFELAFKEQLLTGSYHWHRKWINILLAEYYDPMYKYQLQKTTKKILFKGNPPEVLEYLKSLH